MADEVVGQSAPVGRVRDDVFGPWLGLDEEIDSANGARTSMNVGV